MSASRLAAVLSISLQLCILELSTNKMRSLLTCLGIFLGVAALLINLTMVRGLDENIRRNLTQIGGIEIVTVRQVEASNKEETIRFQRSPGLTLADAESLAASVPAVRAVLPKADMRWRQVKAMGVAARGRIVAVGKDHLAAYDYLLGASRPLAAEDFAQGRRVCIIGQEIAEELFGGERAAIGATLVVERIPLIVVGTIRTEMRFDQRLREILIPYDLYRSHLARRSARLNEIAVWLRPRQDLEKARFAMEDLLLSLHRGVRDVEIELNRDKIKEMESASMGMKVILYAIAFISLLVGGISIMNIMFATIGDRIREIGIRKALGAKRGDILMQFLIEAILLSCVGGIPGMVIAALFGLVPPGVFPFDPVLSIDDFSLAFAFTVTAGLVSGLFPALRAAKMEPVDALRY